VTCRLSCKSSLHSAADLGLCALSCRFRPLRTQLQSLASSSNYKSPEFGHNTDLDLNDLSLFLLFDPIYTITSRVTLLQYHGPNTLDSLKQTTKTIDPLHYDIILQKGGASTYSSSLISWAIFQILHCTVHFALYYVLHYTLCSTKCRVFSKN